MKFNPIELTWLKDWKELSILNFRFNKETGTRHLLAIRFTKVMVDTDTDKWQLTIAFLFNWYYRF